MALRILVDSWIPMGSSHRCTHHRVRRDLILTKPRGTQYMGGGHHWGARPQHSNFRRKDDQNVVVSILRPMLKSVQTLNIFRDVSLYEEFVECFVLRVPFLASLPCKYTLPYHSVVSTFATMTDIWWYSRYDGMVSMCSLDNYTLPRYPCGRMWCHRGIEWPGKPI